MIQIIISSVIAGVILFLFKKELYPFLKRKLQERKDARKKKPLLYALHSKEERPF